MVPPLVPDPPALDRATRPWRWSLLLASLVSVGLLVGCGGTAQNTVNLGFFTGISVSPTQPIDRQNYTIGFSIENLDEQDSTVTNVQWTVARNGLANAYTGTIPALRSHQPVPITITDNEPPGTYVYTVTIDPLQQIVETTRADNTLSATVVVAPISIE